MTRWMILLLLLLLGGSVEARVEAYHFDDPAKEARYKSLIAELRCLVCQNQNLADSNAELAVDLRRQTYEMVSRGASDEEVITYMVDRYGDFVLYRPPFRKTTALLWIGPFVIMGVGLLVLILFIRGRTRQKATELTGEEHQRAQNLLKDRET